MSGYPLNLAIGVVHAAEGSCEVEIISYGPRSFQNALHPGVTLRVLRADNQPKIRLDMVSWDLAAAIADADLVHLHAAYNRSSEMGLLLARQQRKPICLTDHGSQTSTLGQDLGIIELADLIIANSAFGASLYRTRRPIEVILGGVDATRFTPSPSNVRPERDRVLFVGRLLPHKGIDRLIDALPSGLPLTICGRPYDEGCYRNLRWRAEGKDITFVTDADDALLLDLYRRAWVNVLPSVYRDCYGNTYAAPELMGFTLQEAMACGTPAICTRVGGMPEYIEEGRTGFIVDSVEELRDRLERLASEPGLADQMGAEARRVVEREYDLKVAGRRMLAAYQRVFSTWDRAGRQNPDRVRGQEDAA